MLWKTLFFFDGHKQICEAFPFVYQQLLVREILLVILPKNSKIGKIEFISIFADERTLLDNKVDLIFSNAVFEHIEDINGVLKFSKNHLNNRGELFFAVPNAQRELEIGDPALFIHEHVHYYTIDVIKYLLAKNGFEVKSIIQECSAIYVSAFLNDQIELPTYSPVLYKDYSNILDKKLSEFENIMNSNNNIIIHGANNKLNNILGWLKKDFSFTLVDNDENKYKQNFFGKRVQSSKKLNLIEYDIIIVIPTCFYEIIIDEYLNLGYTGKFFKVQDK